MRKILVWDWPVRLGHWLMVLAFVTAWLTAEEHDYEWVHSAAGVTLLGTVLFRVLWGVIGSHFARFSNFIGDVRSVSEYLISLLSKEPKHFTGHNPAGSWAILLLLSAAIFTSLSGYLALIEFGGEIAEELHEGLAILMLAIVLVHVSGVIVSSYLHRENLVWSMITGMKNGVPREEIGSARPLGLIGLLAVVSLVFGLSIASGLL